MIAKVSAAASFDSPLWPPVRDTNLVLEEGSALDFSAWTEPGPAGKWGRVVIDNGRLVFAQRPHIPQRFFAATLIFTPASGSFPDHANADMMARQIKMMGYNVSRFHFVDAMLMSGRKDDFDVDAEQLDRFHYLLAALKKQGVYWLIDLISSPNAAFGGVEPHRWISKYDIKLGLYHDLDQQNHWREWCKRRLTEKNPYTQLKLKDDPALLGLVLMNENGFAYLGQQGFPRELTPKFNTWLSDNHKSLDILAERWGDLGAEENWQQASIEFPSKRWWPPSPRMADTMRFAESLQKETHTWMERDIRSWGYAGLVTQFNNGHTLAENAARHSLAWVDQHGYHDHPSDFVSPKSSMRQVGLIADDLPLVKQLALSRHQNKPFTVSEYGLPFWSHWRREAAVVIPSFAAFQGWDLLAQYGMVIDLQYGKNQYPHKQAIYPFSIGLDPIARAIETLSAAMYLRGDVETTSNRAKVLLSDDYIYDIRGGLGELPDDIARLSLVTGVGLHFQNKSNVISDNDVVFVPISDKGVFKQSIQKLKTKLGVENINAWAANVEQLREANVLTKQNMTNPEDGIYQSDTQQLTINRGKQWMSVVAPRIEALSFVKQWPSLPTLNVLSASTAASMGLISLDAKPIHSSEHMLFVVATDALNSDMRFADAQRQTLLDIGRLPVRLEPISLTVDIKHHKGKRAEMYALSLTGRRVSELQTTLSKQGTTVKLDTAQLPHGPTVYFEFVLRN